MSILHTAGDRTTCSPAPILTGSTFNGCWSPPVAVPVRRPSPTAARRTARAMHPTEGGSAELKEGTDETFPRRVVASGRSDVTALGRRMQSRPGSEGPGLGPAEERE